MSAAQASAREWSRDISKGYGGDAEAGREPGRLRALYKQALATAMRRGELLGQEWGRDVDLDEQVTVVTEQRVKTRAGIVVGPPKTKAGSREIALDDVMAAVLAEHRAEQEANARRRARRGWRPGWCTSTPTARR